MNDHGETRLQVLICTFGKEGIRRVCLSAHPAVYGVEYLVSWQLPDGDCAVPEELARRDDFRIVKSATRGLSRNRNIALDAATAPLVLISDDDVCYTAEQLVSVMSESMRRPDADLIAMQYESPVNVKKYLDEETDLRCVPRGCGYYVSSIEICLRPEHFRDAGVRFDGRFGIGARFMAGEEQILIDDALRAGLSCRFIPVVICRHDGSTTSDRHLYDPEFICAKGAVVGRIHPFTWPLRMVAHALREAGRGKPVGRFAYVKAWISGVISLWMSEKDKR